MNATACDDPSWQEGVFRAQAIIFCLAFPAMMGVWFYFTRNGDFSLYTINRPAVWALAVFPEIAVFAALFASWLSAFPCFFSNCGMEGCGGHDAVAIMWIVVFPLTFVVYYPIRFLGLVKGIVDRGVSVDGESASEASTAIGASVEGMFSSIFGRSDHV